MLVGLPGYLFVYRYTHVYIYISQHVYIPWEGKDHSNNGVFTKDYFENGLSHSRSFTLGELDLPVLKHSATGSADISGNPPKGPLNSWCLRISVGDCPKGIIDGTTTTNTWKTNDFRWIFTQWSFTPKNGLSPLKVVFHGLLTVISRSIHGTHCCRTNWFKCVWGRKAWLDSFYPTRMNFKTTKFLYAKVLLFSAKKMILVEPSS